MITWLGNQACQQTSSIVQNSILNISGATKNETYTIIVKLKTEGKDDMYERKVIVTNLITAEEEKPKFFVEIKQNSTNTESESTKEKD